MSDAEQLRRQAEHCQQLAAGVATFPGLAASLVTTARRCREWAAKLDTVAAKLDTVAATEQQQQQSQNG